MHRRRNGESDRNDGFVACQRWDHTCELFIESSVATATEAPLMQVLPPIACVTHNNNASMLRTLRNGSYNWRLFRSVPSSRMLPSRNERKWMWLKVVRLRESSDSTNCVRSEDYARKSILILKIPHGLFPRWAAPHVAHAFSLVKCEIYNALSSWEIG